MSRITTSTLECGLTLVVETIPGVRSLGLSWFVPAGLARDPDDRLGLSAIWEEMLLRGAGGLDSRAHADALDSLGASRSVGAGTFGHTLSSAMLGSRFADVLPLLVDIVRRPRFEERDLAPARDLCLQGLASLADDPQERVMVDLRAHHAPSPINRSSYGTSEGLRGVTIDEVRDGWSARGVPNGSILALAGCVDATTARAQVERALEGWSGRSEDVAISSETDRGYHHRVEQTNQCHIALAWDAPKESDEGAWLERVAMSVLSGGMSGRLFTEVREKRGLCYSVHASFAADRDFGRSIAYSGTTPDRAGETLKVLRGELERITTAEGAVTPGEFARAIIGMKSKLVMSGESTGARASALARDLWKLGRARSLDELAAAVDAISLEQVNEYLAQRTMGETTTCTLGPERLEA